MFAYDVSIQTRNTIWTDVFLKNFKTFNQKTHAPGKHKSNSTKEFKMKPNSSIPLPLPLSQLNLPPRGHHFQVLKICFF